MGKADPFSRKFDAPMLVTENRVNEFLSPSAKELLSELGHMLEMDFLNAKTQVTMHGFRYALKRFKTDIEEAESKNGGGLSLAAQFSASKVQVKADKVVLSLVIPGKNPLPAINIEILDPFIAAYHDKLLNFSTQLQLLDKKENFGLLLEEADFASLALGIAQNKDAVSFDMKGVNIPKVSIKIGNKELKFDQKKIEALIMSKKEALKELLLAQVSSLLTEGLAAQKLQAINEVSVKKEHWIDSSTMESMIRMSKFEGKANGKSIQLTLDGDFCTNPRYQSLKQDCLKGKATPPAKSRINENLHEGSLSEIDSMLDHGEANIVVSISEDYVNKAISTAYDAGLLDQQLKAAGVLLGPNKLFMRLDEKGAGTGTLFLDVLYSPKKLESMAVGTKEVRFPLAMKVGLKVTSEKGVPNFVLYVTDVDTSDEMLLKGRPEFGVVSNIGKLRFKKKILDTIRKETVSLNNKDLMSLKHPKLRGLGLDKINFESDGQGRMNALVLLKPTNEEISEVNTNLQ